MAVIICIGHARTAVPGCASVDLVNQVHESPCMNHYQVTTPNEIIQVK